MNKAITFMAAALAAGGAYLAGDMLFGASGDPYVRWRTDRITLSSSQRTTLANHIATKWPSIVLADIAAFECASDVDCSWQCRPLTNATFTGASIRSQLLTGQTWMPGQAVGTQLTTWPWQCYDNSAMSSVRTYFANVAPETSGNPLLSALFRRDGSEIKVIIEYKRGMSAADCLTYADRILEPMGVQP